MQIQNTRLAKVFNYGTSTVFCICKKCILNIQVQNPQKCAPYDLCEKVCVQLQSPPHHYPNTLVVDMMKT